MTMARFCAALKRPTPPVSIKDVYRYGTIRGAGDRARRGWPGIAVRRGWSRRPRRGGRGRPRPDAGAGRHPAAVLQRRPAGAHCVPALLRAPMLVMYRGWSGAGRQRLLEPYPVRSVGVLRRDAAGPSAADHSRSKCSSVAGGRPRLV
ncbi:hypothetical protein HBB16_16695 [Pseudonocardia sp. MCCB 268]|nr:hypothetical protein [Pseudonocardia cytotoxica]